MDTRSHTHRQTGSEPALRDADPALVRDQLEQLGGGSLPLSRRGLLSIAAAFGGLAFLAGCTSSRPSSAGLPGPVWPDDPSRRPPAPAPTPGRPKPTTPEPMTGVVARREWTAAGPNMAEINPMNGIRRITVHHDGMPPTTLSTRWQVVSRLEQIRRAHVQDRNWADIGYHYIIDPSGRVWEGRSIRFQGAHVKDQNENNIGILVLGNFDQQRPTPEACSTLDAFVAAQMRRYNVPMSDVRTHQERAPTACPGRNLQSYMVATRSGSGRLASI